MEERYFKEYSKLLDREMEYKIYGHAGKLCLVLPTQNNHFHEWEYRGMYESVKDYIEAGRVRFLAVDGIDQETWSNTYGNPLERVELHERWIQYILQECIPAAKEHIGYQGKMLALGCSLGATHAANIFFRYPDQFSGILGMSGVYDVDQYYGGQHNEVSYNNNPMAYLSNMPLDHEYIEKYNASQMIFVVGQGAWEDVCKEHLGRLRNVLAQKKIHAWIDFWGQDVYHDWPWWQKELRYFIDKMVI